MHERMATNVEAKRLLELAQTCFRQARVSKAAGGVQTLTSMGEEYLERAKRPDPEIMLDDD